MNNSLKNTIPALCLIWALLQSPLFAQYNIGYKEQGNAAYYADKLHGRPTASGEIYDKNAFTTAHKTIPFGTIVKITNLDNGKSINLKVNDRGPFHPDKMVDLSRAAAEYLDFIKKGVVPVELEIMGDDAIVLPNQSIVATQNTNFNAPAVEKNEQNNQIVNTVPKTQPYIEPQERKTRSISNTLPATKALNKTIQTNPVAIEIEQVGFMQRGKATFFGSDRNGKITVTGEEFKASQLVAAHPNIQLNSLVKVTNLDNGNEVIVRINDRPNKSEIDPQTIIILSEKAAENLEILQAGSTDVKLEIINSGEENNQIALDIALDNESNEVLKTNNEQMELMLSPEEARLHQLEAVAALIKPVNSYNVSGEVQRPEGFGVQVASYNNQQNALEKALEFEALQFNNVLIQAGWSNGERSFRVLLGEFSTREKAAKLANFLVDTEIKPFIRKHLQTEKQ